MDKKLLACLGLLGGMTLTIAVFLLFEEAGTECLAPRASSREFIECEEDFNVCAKIASYARLDVASFFTAVLSLLLAAHLLFFLTVYLGGTSH